MVRSAAAFLAVLIRPALSLAQEPERAHTVVDDDTLWDLSDLYYSSPWEWRLIWNANRSEIADPNLIYPGQVFTIPGATADRLAGGEPAVGDRPAGGEQPDQPPTGGQPDGPMDQPASQETSTGDQEEMRTIFYRQQQPVATVMTMMDDGYVAVDVDEVYSAPFLGPLLDAPEHLAVVRGSAEESRGPALRQFQLVRLDTDAPVRVGDQFRTFRVTQFIEAVGQVVTPTGLVSVTAVGDTTAVAVVTKQYRRMLPGDLVGPVPSYELTTGVVAEDVTGGSAAMIMGSAGRQQLNDLGHNLFIDLGSDAGIDVGDEFVLYSEAVSTDERGRLQVVSVQPASSTVRIVQMSDDVFRQGVIVRLARQMP
jgi:hypothetical protein